MVGEVEKTKFPVPVFGVAQLGNPPIIDKTCVFVPIGKKVVLFTELWYGMLPDTPP